MKRDLRKQTFSKPAKPSDEEIRKLTSGDEANEPAQVQPVKTVKKENVRKEIGEEQSSKEEPAGAEPAGAELGKAEFGKAELAEIREKVESPVKRSVSYAKDGGSTQATAQSANSMNPFLLLRGQTSEVKIEKTGYRLRSDYMDLLKLVKRMKKGHTLEAVLDDALTFYFENSDDGRKAFKQRQMLDSDDDI